MRVEGGSFSPVLNSMAKENPGEIRAINGTGRKDTQDPAQQQLKATKEKEIISAIEAANDEIQIYNYRLQFSIHEKTKEIMVKVIDDNSGEVIREIPPEKILDMVAKLWELAGLFVDEKV